MTSTPRALLRTAAFVHAAAMPGQVRSDVKARRVEAVMAAQREISADLLEEWVGRDTVYVYTDFGDGSLTTLRLLRYFNSYRGDFLGALFNELCS